MSKRKRHSGVQKEKMGMIAASVFVLSALTLTGVYFAAQEDLQQEKNLIDFAQLEQQQNTADEQDKMVADTRFTNEKDTQLSESNDMDVDPEYTEVNSGMVTNGTTVLAKSSEIIRDRYTHEENSQETLAAEEMQEAETPQIVAAAPSFSAEETLQWPIVGEVLLNYSMDKAIYFPTMQQYRYNPSMVIAAQQGETITAAADGVVKEVTYNAQTGNTVIFDLGDGYELTYGQLTDITLAQGEAVQAGDVVGKVAAPTIYYAEEGCNVYFMLTKNGIPINPLERMPE